MKTTVVDFAVSLANLRLALSRTILFALSLALVSCGGENDRKMTFSGIMDANTVRVSAQTPGEILAIHFDEGMEVKRKQKLLEIEVDKLAYQLEQNHSALEEISIQSQVAASQVNTANAARDNLATKYERFKALLKSNAVTQQAVDDLKTQLDAANEQLKAAQLSLNAIARKKDQLESGMKILKKQINDAEIKAPIDGMVLVRYCEKGELLGVGSPVCEIADLGSLWTKIYISETQLPTIRLGQSVEIKIDGMPDKSFDASLTWISDKAEFTPKTILTEETRTTLVFPVKVTVKNPEGILKIGMPVTIVIERKS